MINMCRLCLNKSSEIIEELQDGCDILNKLSKSLSHYVSLTKELPNKICFTCVNKVQDIYKYHQTISQNELILQQQVNRILCDGNNTLIDIKQENCYEENELPLNKGSINQDVTVPINVKPELILTSKDTNSLDDDNILSIVTNNENSLNNLKLSQDNRNPTKININYKSIEDVPLKILEESKNSTNFSTNIDESKIYKCLTCFQTFPKQRELLRHYQTVEFERYNEKNVEINEKTELIQYKTYVTEKGTLMYKCEGCYRKYAHKTYIERHIKSHVQKRPFLCKLCGKTYQTASIIVAHGKMHSGEMYMCSYNCGYRSVHKHVIKDHEKRHRKEYKFKCEECGKGFQVRTSYEQHQNIHKGIRPFACEICGMTFHLHKYLTTHRSKIHPQTSVRKPWICKQCSLPCDSKHSLNIHLKDEHGIIVKISMLCDICGKVFRETQQLRSHQRSVHLNVKPYTCSVCNKSFPKKFTLKLHEQAHTGKLHTCSMCDKKFSRHSSLHRHFKRFHMGSKLKCQKCEKAYTSKLKLTAHIKSCKNIDVALT